VARLNILLSAILVLCALALVTAQHRARQLFIDLDSAKARTLQIETRWNELQVEQRQYSRNSLIDGKARSELSMSAVAPQRTLMLTMHGDQPRLAQMLAPAPGPSKPAPGSSAGAIVVRGKR
jgi:cell division protein FtsL